MVATPAVERRDKGLTKFFSISDESWRIAKKRGREHFLTAANHTSKPKCFTQERKEDIHFEKKNCTNQLQRVGFCDHCLCGHGWLVHT